MKLIEDLRAEHDLIEQVIGALRTFVNGLLAGTAAANDGPAFIRFLRLYAGDFHHAREEDTLFVALVEQAALPGDRGPIAVLKDDHRRMSAMLNAVAHFVGSDLSVADNRAGLERAVTEYIHALGHHIDAENSVLLPESEARLRRNNISELPGRPMTSEEMDAKRIGEELIRRYPPARDASVIRGDGCVLCPAFAETCRGLEAEWWNEWEWEEFEDHLPSG